MAAPQKRSTLVDVARLAGVSAKTVSRVYSEPDKVGQPTKAKVLAAAERLLFKPNALARELRMGGNTGLLAYITPELTNPFFIQVAAGVERECAANGLTMALSASDSVERELEVIDAMLAGRARCVLLVPLGDDYSFLEGERRLGTAIVAIDRLARNLLADSVVLANREGGYLATKKLIEAGHRSIGFVCSPVAIFTQQLRLEGYRQALREARLSIDSRWESVSDDPEVTMESLVERVIDARVTAIVGGNNRATTSILRVFGQRGIELGLVGFDDFDIADFHGVSVVAHDPGEMGRVAVQLALRRLQDPTGHTEHVELPVRYIARGSGERAPG
ncbi:MAG: LacI family transcriptional regulator [Propionibacteriaceae bacterium]|jgi:LacI family transcriptional regulator|nr:LacI family transcriptional regulator [Propionibacteriaceae bacterium]